MADYHVVSVSHIDMAFVMRREAYAEMTEILLERIIQVLERRPELHFALEQAAHYRELETTRPDLIAKIKTLLQTGRLEFMGGMATTAETNFPNGECLVRNQGMGLRWVEDHLGVRPRQGWLIDTFGLNPQVPQIMRQFGFQHLYANRFGGDKTLDVFQAQGLDGSRVVVMGCDSASANLHPDTQALVFCRSWADVDTLFAKADKLQGPLPKLVVYYLENEELFSEYYVQLTRQRQQTGSWLHSTYQAYTDALTQSGYVPPVLQDDLNPEFTGTFALRPPIKVQNRQAENWLLSAEKYHAVLSQDVHAPLEDAWWKMFHCQFHDAFTGSHEDITYEDILQKFASVQLSARQTLQQALQIQPDDKHITCCNSLPIARKEWIQLESVDRNVAVYDHARRLPCCRRGDTVYFEADLPAGGAAMYALHDAEAPMPPRQLSGKTIENEFFRLTLDERDGIQCLEDRQGFCYMAQAGSFLVVEEDRGGMQIEQCSGNMLYASSGTIHVGPALADTMGQWIEMEGTFPTMPWSRNSRLDWSAHFSLRKGERMLRLQLTLRWHGDYIRIRMRLPLLLKGRDFYNEVPFGVTRREMYRARPTAKGEWPARRFAALEDGAHGLALLNQGIAGVEQEGNAIVTTLLRAYGDGPDAWVKPTPASCQWGTQNFSFAVAPYTGTWQENNIFAMTQSFDQPVLTIPGACEAVETSTSLFELTGNGIELSTIKKAWDGSGDLVARIYESYGQKQAGVLRITGITAAWSANIMEEKQEPLSVQNFAVHFQLTPFEIKTIRFARKDSMLIMHNAQ